MKLTGPGLGLALLVACAPEPVVDVRDCAVCPATVKIRGGSFLMGTAESDRLIDPRTGSPATSDGPQHLVSMPPFAIGKYEVSVNEYRAFVSATGHTNDEGCIEFSKKDSFTISTEVNWDMRGLEQQGDEPVGCVSYFDALAYVEWLSDKTGEPYRLPTEAEWEYAARAGSITPYFWGADPAESCNYANVRSFGAYNISERQAQSDIDDGFPCDDGSAHSSPAGSYAPNLFGLHDMQGNNWEWVTDCNHKDYEGAPSNGSAWLDDEACNFGVIRGGSYLNRVERSSTTVRAGRPRSGKATNMGFRVAKGELPEPVLGPKPQLAAAQPEPAGEDEMPVVEDTSVGAMLFDENCAACHVMRDNFVGLYGEDQESLVRTIRDGGNNIMSMPAFGNVLSPTQIEVLAAYVRKKNGWAKPKPSQPGSGSLEGMFD